MIPTDRADNLRINVDEFNRGVTRLGSLPPVLFVELTQNCNLHCRMCRSGAGFQPDLNMADGVFELLRRDLFPFASMVDLRGWGESTILPDFADRIEKTVLTGARLRLVTNALAINGDLWALLMDSGAGVVVSVDAATPETMSVLGRGSFAKLVRSLESGARERDRAARGTIAFNTVLTSANLHEVADIVRMAARFGAGRVTVFPVVAARSNALHLDHRKSEIARFMREAETAALELGMELRIGASLHEELVVEDGLPDRCSHPWEYCYIDYAGNVGYCDHLIGNSALMLGNLSSASFDEIWNGARFQELRELHAQARRGRPGALGAALPHCGWCYERRYVDFEDDTNPTARRRVVSTGGTLPLLATPDGPFRRTDFMSGRKLAPPPPVEDSPPGRSAAPAPAGKGEAQE